jgi:hypothetical protein
MSTYIAGKWAGVSTLLSVRKTAQIFHISGSQKSCA